MNYPRAILCVAITVAIIVLLGRLEHKKHPETYVYVWILSIIVLLITWGNFS